MYDTLKFKDILNIRKEKLQKKYSILFEKLKESEKKYDDYSKVYLDENEVEYIYCGLTGGEWWKDNKERLEKINYLEIN